MGVEHYLKARREGMREVHTMQARGEDATLPVLSEIVPSLNRLSQVPLGILQISLDRIAGTATKGRTTAFSPNFMPMLDPTSEFASKWIALYDDVIKEGLRQPIKALEYYNRFYIVEGNKRVSVSKMIDSAFIEADVIRIIPEEEDSERYRIYQEYLSFYKDTQIHEVYFDHEGDFAHLYELMGKTPGKRWTTEDKDDFQSVFYRFSQAYTEQGGSRLPMNESGAFLVYLEIYGYQNSIGKTPGEIAQEIKRIQPEFAVAASGKPAALLSQPAEKQQGILMSVLRPQQQTVKCAFLYNRTPQDSSWTYWHELGRKGLEESFGKRVETIVRENVPQEDAPAAIEELISGGAQVVFASSPVFLDACIRASAQHPQVKILNCSLLASYHNVRSYYLRIYEAKFVLGAIAGALAENDKIGYIADYPIYGVPASINAFALGAQMTNPRAKIYLEWSTIPGIRPEEALRANEVSIISGRDISAPNMESRAFGLYEEMGETTKNIAMPVWNWQKLYEGIVRSILTGAWQEEETGNADRALSYYMGMATDAIDIVCSRKLPARIRRLVELLRERIRSGAFQPMVGPIVDQAGDTRVEADVEIDLQDIIHMDYLADNVVGRIPKLDELTQVACGIVSLQGISATASGPTPAERLRAAKDQINVTEENDDENPSAR